MCYIKLADLGDFNVEDQTQGKDTVTVAVFIQRWNLFELQHDKTNKMTCAPNEDSVQPAQPRSLISLHCPHEEALGPWLFLERTAKTLIRQADLSVRLAHMSFCWKSSWRL